MPMMDLTAAVANPLMQSRIKVRRREASVAGNGRSSHSDTTFPLVYGIVEPEGDNSNDRQKDYATSAKTISVTTRFPLRDQVRNALPDVVIWHGNEYLCTEVDDMTEYGPGFIIATCVCEDLQTAPQATK